MADTSKYDEFESNATFIGIVCIMDPLRSEVPKSIKDCQTAGIKVIMITGDAKNTAASIATSAGILPEGSDHSQCVFTGTEFGQMSAEQKIQAVNNGRVFARVEPAHKRELVKVLKEQG